MRVWNWIKDHRTQSLICLAALVVGVLALARDVIGYQIIDPARKGPERVTDDPRPPAQRDPGPSFAPVRRGPDPLRMIGGRPDVLETEVDLDSTAPNWGVNSCGTRCDLNLRGSPNGVEEAYGNLARSPAGRDSCRAATAYGFTLTPREAEVGTQLCVLTDEGRSAGLIIKKVQKSDADHVESIDFEVTVWEK